MEAEIKLLRRKVEAGADFVMTQAIYDIEALERFLEKAIRTCPHSPEALRAYFALEEHVLTAYTGSGGLNLPPEEEARLDELWRLVGKP